MADAQPKAREGTARMTLGAVDQEEGSTASDRQDGVLLTWREAPRPAKALLLGVLVNKLGSFIQIYLVLFLTQRGFSVRQAGVALGVYGAGAVIGTVVGGALTDRLSPRSATLISMVGSSALIVSILYLRVYSLLLIALLVIGTVGQLYRPAAQMMLMELTPPKRLVMMTAMYRLSMNVGTTATPLIGAAVLAVSYDLLFWAEAAAALVYAVIAFFELPVGTGPPLAAGAVADQTAPPSKGYLAILGDWRYCTFLLSVFLISVAYVQYLVTLPLAVSDAGLSVWWYSAVVALNGFIVITSELLMTRVVQGWPIRLTILLGLGLVAIGYGLYAVAIVPAVLIAGTLIWTLSEIVGAPTVFAYPGMAAPPNLRGRYIGAMQSFFGLGTAVGPVIGVLLWDQFGNAVWLWIALIAAVATAAGMVGVRAPDAGALAEV